MKFVFTFIFLILSANAFAQGSSKLSCTSNEGISFSSDNGFAEITIDSVSSDAAITNYSFDDQELAVTVDWIGGGSILSEVQENSCNRDFIATIFKQQALVTNKLTNDSKMIEVVCTEEIVTSSGAELDECLGD